MNRFEKYPRLTFLAVFFLLTVLLLSMVEFALNTIYAGSGLYRAGGNSETRALMMREWKRDRTRIFRAPKIRANDPRGPVQETYELRTDGHGFIWPSVIHDKPDMEIAFLGGSTTECLYIRPEFRFPYLIGRNLETQTKLKINALNAARSGNVTMHSLLNYLGKIAPRRPAYVVLMHATNDIGILGRFESYWNGTSSGLIETESTMATNTPVEKLFQNLLDATIPTTARFFSFKFKMVKHNIASLLGGNGKNAGTARRPDLQTDPAGHDPAADLERKKRLLDENFRPALLSFVRLVGAWGSQPVLSTQILVADREIERDEREGAFLSKKELQRAKLDSESLKIIHDYANAIIRETAKQEGALLIDLARARAWTREDVYDGLHLTETGSRRVADIMAKALLKKIEARRSGTPYGAAPGPAASAAAAGN